MSGRHESLGLCTGRHTVAWSLFQAWILFHTKDEFLFHVYISSNRLSQVSAVYTQVPLHKINNTTTNTNDRWLSPSCLQFHDKLFTYCYRQIAIFSWLCAFFYYLQMKASLLRCLPIFKPSITPLPKYLLILLQLLFSHPCQPDVIILLDYNGLNCLGNCIVCVTFVGCVPCNICLC